MGDQANQPNIRLSPSTMPKTLAPSMFAKASAACSFTGHGMGAAASPVHARTATCSTAAMTSPADHAMPLSPIQKCDTMPATPPAPANARRSDVPAGRGIRSASGPTM